MGGWEGWEGTPPVCVFFSFGGAFVGFGVVRVLVGSLRSSWGLSPFLGLGGVGLLDREGIFWPPS